MEIMFIQMFKVRDEVEKMVENHEICLSVMEDIKARTVDDSQMENYVLGRLFDLIKKHKTRLTDYVYMDSKGAAQPLTSLTGKQTKFAEYYLMEAYMALDGKSRDRLNASAQDELKHVADVEFLQKKWLAYRDKMIGAPLEVLNDEWEDIEDGEKLLSSYQRYSCQ